jgi:hypothetical protein
MFVGMGSRHGFPSRAFFQLRRAIHTQQRKAGHFMNLINKNDNIETDPVKRAKYEDYICQRLHERGIVVQPVKHEGAGDRCNNLLGLDIVYAPNTTKREGVHIETNLKPHPPTGILLESTLFRDNGAWLYGVGDYDYFFIFGKNTLREFITTMEIHLCCMMYAKRYETERSKGIFLSFALAEELAERRFNLGGPNSMCQESIRPFESSRRL